MRALVFAAALYLIIPGHPDALLSGVPLGQTGTVLVILLIGCWAWTRDSVPSPPPPWLLGAVIAAIVVKIALGTVAPASGWLGAYYANDRFEPPVRRSLDFIELEATRIDRQLRFAGTGFPVHFFNDPNFNFGVLREVTLPFSVQWRGHLRNDEPLTLGWDGAGTVAVSVDNAAQQPPVVLPPGEHVIDVRYSKPADTEGRLRVSAQDANGAARDWRLGEITPGPEPPWRRSLAMPLVYAASLISIIVVLLTGIGLAPAVVAKIRRSRSLHPYVAPAVLLALTAQGLWKSRHLVGRVWTLTGGDDWLAFEMNARDALLNGWMMTRHSKVAYYEYPGYGYFVAAVHAVTGESLAGVVLMNFVVLALATIVIYLLARQLTAPRAAYVAVVWLMAVEQLAFVRYYTVTLLSENLFFPLAAATVYFAVCFASGGRARWLAAAGIAGGLAAVTRPTMMAYLPCVIVLAMIARARADGVLKTSRAVVLFGALWMLTISPITIRNYIVSGTPVLITEGAAVTFVRYNVPRNNADAERKYLLYFRGGNAAAAVTLAQILWEYPGETLRNWGIKIGFALGMVHWLDLRPHPELILTSALWLLAVLLLKESRTRQALLVHAFILTHMATLLLTVPWNYGYRMLLAMYLFMPIFAGALIIRALDRWAPRTAGVESTTS